MEGRLPHPLDERGVPVKPTNLAECYDVCLKGTKDTNRHHIAFNRANYKTPAERNYRECSSMIMRVCMCKHSDFHATYLPPSKPDIHVMYDVIQGDYQPTEQVVFIRSRELVNLDNTA